MKAASTRVRRTGRSSRYAAHRARPARNASVYVSRPDVIVLRPQPIWSYAKRCNRVYKFLAVLLVSKCGAVAVAAWLRH